MGPITQARASLTTLKLALGGLVVVVLGLAAATLALWARLSRATREVGPLADGRAPSRAQAPSAGAPSGRPPGFGP